MLLFFYVNPGINARAIFRLGINARVIFRLFKSPDLNNKLRLNRTTKTLFPKFIGKICRMHSFGSAPSVAAARVEHDFKIFPQVL